MWTTSSTTIIEKLDRLIQSQQETNLLLRELITAQTSRPAVTQRSGLPKRALPYTDKDVTRTGQVRTEDLPREERSDSASPTASS